LNGSKQTTHRHEAIAMKQPARHIVISDEEHQLPFSKGLMAARIMATGLAPARAFHVAERVEDRLHESGVAALTQDELLDVAYQVLVDEVGERYAESFANWHVARALDRPLVLLIGGATGVGKSTIATQVAARLGITRIIPTDAIREVMRAMFSDDMLPALHASSFEADRLAARNPLPRTADPTIIGYREQCAAVMVGVRALVRRAMMERTDLILEGAHIAPGFLDLSEFGDAVVVPFVVTVDDEELHRSHFTRRALESRGRTSDRYLRNFDNIRKIQRYVKTLATEHDMPIIPSYNLDATLSQVIELVVSEATRAIAPPATPASPPLIPTPSPTQ
jgi:2-phosphoglycerate kinase